MSKYNQYPGIVSTGGGITIRGICINSTTIKYCKYAIFTAPLESTINVYDKCECGNFVYDDYDDYEDNITVIHENKTMSPLYFDMSFDNDKILDTYGGKMILNKIKYKNARTVNNAFYVTNVTKNGQFLAIHTEYHCNFINYIRQSPGIHCTFCGQIGCDFHDKYIEDKYRYFLLSRIWLIAQLLTSGIAAVIGAKMGNINDNH